MPARATLVAAVTLLTATLTTTAARAHHNDWALPLLGGAVGGYALKSVLGAKQAGERPTPAAPRPASAAQPASATASVESRLNQLDTLAANGYITKQEYQQRRQAILDGI